MVECEDIKKLITDFFNESIKVEANGKECLVVFPIFGSDNDLINFYVRKSSEKKYQYYITDCCETISKLYTLGVEIKEEGMAKEILDSIEQGLNVSIKDNEIIAYANDDDIGLIISKIMSAILGVEYIRYISKPRHIPMFKKDVKIYLNEIRPEYYENISVEGKSGETFEFDFGYLDQEMYIDTLYATTPREALHLTDYTIVKKFDMGELKQKSKVVAIYDDVDKEAKDVWKGNPLYVMNHFLDEIVPWSKKEKILEIIQ